MSELVDWGKSLLTFSAPVQEEYAQAAPGVLEKLSADDFREWAEAGARLAERGFRSWQASLEYFRATPEVLDLVPLRRVLAWARLGGDLAEMSAELSCAFVRAGPQTLAHLNQIETVAWGGLGARLYKGEWQSGALAVKFFQATAPMFPRVTLFDLNRLVSLLEHLAAISFPLAQQCLELTQSLLPRYDPPQREHILALALALSRNNPEAAKLWLTQTPVILSRIEHTEQVRFLHIAEKMTLLERPSSEVLDYLAAGSYSLGMIERSVHARILVHADELVAYSSQAAREYVKAGATLLEKLHPDELDEWVSEGIETVKDREEAGISFFKLESLHAQDVLQHLARGVELGQVGDVLRLYCKALTGIDVHVLPVEDLTQRGIGWTSERKPTTEGSNVFLPGNLEVYSNKADNFSCMKVYATHQTGHLEFGSFIFRFERDGLLFHRMRGEVEAYQDKGGVSITDIERFLDLFAMRRLASDIFTLTEDARVDGCVDREYGGIRQFLRRVQRDSRTGRPLVATLPLRSALVEALLQYTLEPARPVAVPEMYQSHFNVCRSFLAKLRAEVGAVEDTAEATLRLYIILRSVPNLLPDVTMQMPWTSVDGPPPADPEEAFEDLFTLQSSSGQSLGSLLKAADTEEDDGPYAPLADVEFRGDFKPELVQTLMKLKQNRNPDADAPVAPLSPEAIQNLLEKLGETEIGEFLIGDTDTTSGMFVTNLLKEAGQNGTPTTAEARQHEKGELEGDELESQEPLEFLYDEWDFRSNDYRHNWCLVKERVLESGTPAFFDETLRKYSRLAAEVRRQFELLKPEIFKKIKNLTDGEEYDLDAVVEAAIDRKSKVTPSEKLYWRRNKEERSVAVAFLLDLSASTDEDVKKERPTFESTRDWDEDPGRYLMYFRERMLKKDEVKKPERRRIIDVEKESTVLLIQALETVGDSYGVYGFSGYGRDNVEIYVIKDLNEQFSEKVKGRIDKMEPVRGTRMGAAIRHTISKLEAFDARVKVLVLLSDGRPQDHNYGRDRTEKEYAIHDTKQALMEAKHKQIIPFALTVDREGHDYLKTMCEGLGYEVVNDIESLPSRLPTLYRQLTV